MSTRPTVSVHATDGQCLRDRRSVSTHRRSVSTRPTVSVYATDGQCLRDLRDPRDYLYALSARFCFTVTAMDPCYSQISTSAARPICQSRCQPKQNVPKNTENPRCIYTVSILFTNFPAFSCALERLLPPDCACPFAWRRAATRIPARASESRTVSSRQALQRHAATA